MKVSNFWFKIEELKFMVLPRYIGVPNHIHLLWRILPSWKLQEVQRDFMKFTGQKIKYDLIQNHPHVLERFYVGLKDRQYQFWERNSLSKFLTSREIVEQKLDYIHNNPVQGKWMLADCAFNYHFSSIRFYESDETQFDFLSHYMESFE